MRMSIYLTSFLCLSLISSMSFADVDKTFHQNIKVCVSIDVPAPPSQATAIKADFTSTDFFDQGHTMQLYTNKQQTKCVSHDYLDGPKTMRSVEVVIANNQQLVDDGSCSSLGFSSEDGSGVSLQNKKTGYPNEQWDFHIQYQYEYAGLIYYNLSCQHTAN